MGFFNAIGNFFSSIGRGISNFFGKISRGIGNFYSKIITGVNESEKTEEKTIDELRPSVFTRTVGQDDDITTNTTQSGGLNVEDEGEFMYSENNKRNEFKTVKFEEEEKKEEDEGLDVTLNEFSEKFKLVDEPGVVYELEITNNSILVLKNGLEFIKKEGSYSFTDQQIQDVLLSLKRDNIELDSNAGIEELLLRLENI